jgi:preprotein translocase subunit SecY
MKTNVWTVLAVLFLIAFLLAPKVSGFLFDSGGNYNVVWPRAYNNWVSPDGHIDVPEGEFC